MQYAIRFSTACHPLLDGGFPELAERAPGVPGALFPLPGI